MPFQLQKELSALSAEKVTEASELRAELRIKSFELTSLGVAFEVGQSFSISLTSYLRFWSTVQNI